MKLSSRPSDGNESLDYIVSIFDESGTVIESASDVELQKVAPGTAKVFGMMEDLYATARRNALGVDSALDALIGELS